MNTAKRALPSVPEIDLQYDLTGVDAKWEGADGTKEQLQAPQVLAGSARVQEVGKTPEGTVVVTVLVPEQVADSLAAYSSAGQVTIIQAPAAGPGE